MSSILINSRVTIGSVGYLPASALERELRGHATWDPQSQVWTLVAGRHELRAAAEMSVVLVDGAPQPLEVPAIFSEGQFLLPESVWSRWVSGWINRGAIPSGAAPSGFIKTIVVDAGHGGHDPGAMSRDGLREKTVNLDIALRLRDLLLKDGFHVIMTRSDDRFVSLDSRSHIANREDADLFVSIHVNASRRRSISGYEVYYLSEATDDQARALAAAENAALPSEVGNSVPEDTRTIVWDLLYTEHRAEATHLASAVCRGLKTTVGASHNRGVKSARFAVLKGSRMPAILVEVGFLTHPSEEARLRSSVYRQRVAEGIRNGIVTFKSSYDQRA